LRIPLLPVRKSGQCRLAFRKQGGKRSGEFMGRRVAARTGYLGGVIGDNDIAQSPPCEPLRLGVDPS
jgi:hypothetical protein